MEHNIGAGSRFGEWPFVANEIIIDELKKTPSGYSYITGNKEDGTLCKVVVIPIKDAAERIEVFNLGKT